MKKIEPKRRKVMIDSGKAHAIFAMQDPKHFVDIYNEANKKRQRWIRILDSTLREGEQHPRVSFTISQRMRIASALDKFGVDQIEISPVISADHVEATKKLVKAGFDADIVAQCRALKSDIDVALRCDANWVVTYLGVSDIHLAHKLRITREEGLQRAVEVVDHLKAHGLKGRFALEDASRADPAYLREICRATTQAGINRIGIADTTGVMQPKGMYNLVRMIRDTVDVPLDVHCHNDIGLSLANSLAGVDAGADQIHVTIDGIGERIGIASLAETAIAIIMFYNSRSDLKIDMLKDLSMLLEQCTGKQTPSSKPLVGETAFTHKAGTHLAAILRNPAAYEIIEPRMLGNRRKLVYGELAGKNAAGFLLSLLGLESKGVKAESLAARLKDLRMGDVLEILYENHQGRIDYRAPTKGISWQATREQPSAQRYSRGKLAKHRNRNG